MVANYPFSYHVGTSLEPRASRNGPRSIIHVLSAGLSYHLSTPQATISTAHGFTKMNCLQKASRHPWRSTAHGQSTGISAGKTVPVRVAALAQPLLLIVHLHNSTSWMTLSPDCNSPLHRSNPTTPPIHTADALAVTRPRYPAMQMRIYGSQQSRMSTTGAPKTVMRI